MGKYPRSTKGNQYLIVATDICSKWIEAKALKVANSTLIIQFLEEEVFTRFGFPQVILSDNGSQFTSHEFEEACIRWGATHHTTAIYSPRQNQCERRNQTIKDKLRLQLLDQPHCNWDKELPQILYSLRNTINQATQVAPAQVYFNQLLRHPADSTELFNDDLALSNDSLFTHHRLANKNQQKYVLRYEGEPFQRLHPIGAIVLIRNHELSSVPKGIAAAFCPKWIGPYEIVHSYPTGVYICRSLENENIQKKVSHQDTQLRDLPILNLENCNISSHSSTHSTLSDGTTYHNERLDSPPLTTPHNSFIPLPSAGTPIQNEESLSFPILPSSDHTQTLDMRTSCKTSHSSLRDKFNSDIVDSNSTNSNKLPRRTYRTRIFNSKYFGQDWVT